MNRKGNCSGNTVMERFFGTLKRKSTDHHLYQTRAQAKQAVISYIEIFYNPYRRHSSLGYKSPMALSVLT